MTSESPASRPPSGPTTSSAPRSFIPVAGAPETVPPPSVPLGFLAAAGIGLIGLGFAVALAAERIVVAPQLPGVIAATHVGMLAFLTVAVLGAMHQFTPVIGRRRLRSILAARLVFVGLVLTAWLLPTGFAHGPEWLIPAAGLLGLATVLLAAWNLSASLASDEGGLPLWGLRIALVYLLATVCFGVVYAFDRQTGWFPLLPNRVLAHGLLGLIGWLGLAYVSVAEKLWPMFLLAHRPRARAGTVAVWSIAAGATPLTIGVLFGVAWVGWIGGLAVIGGLIAHLVSLGTCVRHRRRRLELLHAFLFTSSAFVILAMALGAVAAIADLSPLDRSRVVTAMVAAALGWLGLAVVGHAHKIVPFISYGALRARGIRTNRAGAPLLFSHLFAIIPARITLVLGGTGFALIVIGILADTATAVTAGGLAVASCGAVATINLATGPSRATSGAEPMTMMPVPPARTVSTNTGSTSAAAKHTVSDEAASNTTTTPDARSAAGRSS